MANVMTRASAVWISITLLLCAAAGPAWAQNRADHKRALLVYSFGRAFSPFHDYSSRLRAEFARQTQVDMEIYEVELATARSGEGQPGGPFIDYLYTLFRDGPPDLVITVGAPAARFFQRNRQRLFPSTPMLFTAVDQRMLDESALTRNDAFVATTLNLPAIVENILTLLPQTNRLAVVIGSSPLEKLWTEELRREFVRFAGRMEFSFFNELSLSEMLKRAAALPPRSAILFGVLWVDAAGVAHEEERALAAIHAVANAPMFSYVDTRLGRGIVGGPMISIDAVSRAAAAAALRILSGETAATVKSPVVALANPVFDWRELRRWGISEARLPAGSIVKFREPTVWRRYWWQILGAMAVLLAQAVLIQWLLRERRQRRHSEAAAHELSGRLIASQEEERARLARELHDDVTQRLAVLAIEAGDIERRSAPDSAGEAMRTLRHGLMRLSEDIHTLSYSLHPSVLEDLGLSEALKSECQHFEHTSSVRLQVKADDLPARIPRDVGLCLFRVAQESLRNVARHASASQVDVHLGPLDGGLQITVTDDGVGFDPLQRHNKATLGHASMRQRVALLGGRLEITSKPLWGTVVLAWVPFREAPDGPSLGVVDRELASEGAQRRHP